MNGYVISESVIGNRARLLAQKRSLMQKKEFVELACGRQDICKTHLSVLGFCLGRDGYKLGSQASAFQALLEGLQGAADVGPPSINPSIQHCGYLISLFTFTVYFFVGERYFSFMCWEIFILAACCISSISSNSSFKCPPRKFGSNGSPSYWSYPLLLPLQVERVDVVEECISIFLSAILTHVRYNK